MSFNPIHIWASMGMLSRVIALCLLGMAVSSVAVYVERFLAYARHRKATLAFAKAAGPALGGHDFGAVLAAARSETKGSFLARTVVPVLEKHQSAKGQKGNLSPVEVARREAARQLEATSADLRRGLSLLASVGSIAPFVGLLGTVVGIISAFQGIAKSGSGGLGAVSAGISEALIETAFGLMVAIPAVVLYNMLSGRVAELERTVGQSVGELLDEVESAHGHGNGQHHAKIA
jgi:biopolymer transport protein ExbB